MPIVIGEDTANKPGMRLFVVAPADFDVRQMQSISAKDVSFGVGTSQLRLYESSDMAYWACRHLLNRAGMAIDRPMNVQVLDITWPIGQCMSMFASGKMHGVESCGVCFEYGVIVDLTHCVLKVTEKQMHSISMNKWEHDFLGWKTTNVGSKLCEGCRRKRTCFATSTERSYRYAYC